MSPDHQDQPDHFQQAWQTQSAGARLAVDAELLAGEIRSRQQCFHSAMLWTDLIEVGIALSLLPVWIWMGVAQSSPWTWYLAVPVLIWNIVFTAVYRIRCRPKPSGSGEPLIQCVKDSLNQVEDQIWLTRNFFWWNTLPLAIAILALVAHLSLLKADGWRDAITDVNAVLFVLFAILFYFVHRMSQRAIDAEGGFESRRQELLGLLSSLGDESDGAP